ADSELIRLADTRAKMLEIELGGAKLNASALPGLRVDELGFVQASVANAAKATKEWNSALGALSSDFTQLATISGNSLSPLLRQIGELIKLTDLAVKGFEAMSRATKVTTAMELEAATGAVTLAIAWYQFWQARAQSSLAEQQAAMQLAADRRLADQFHTTA